MREHTSSNTRLHCLSLISALVRTGERRGARYGLSL
jgi:hypothetical protein